jgi:hypothetical protein
MGRESDEFEGMPRERVLEVLRFHGVDVFVSENITHLSKERVQLDFAFPDRLNRRTLQMLSRRFGIPIHHLFRPELMR